MNLKAGGLKEMILNFNEEKNIDDLLKEKGEVNAVRCMKCNNAVAFDLDDIEWKETILLRSQTERGYVECPWCKHKIYVGERVFNGALPVMTRKFFSTLSK